MSTSRIRIRKTSKTFSTHILEQWWKAFCPCCNVVIISVPTWHFQPGPVYNTPVDAFQHCLKYVNKHIERRHHVD